MIRGVTLVELLIAAVAAIVLIVGGYIVWQDFQGALKTGSAQEDLGKMLRMITAAQTGSSRTLTQITGNSCSACQCKSNISYRNIDESDVCYQTWMHDIAKIENADVSVGSMRVFARDPWGSPYFLHENEGVRFNSNCTHDLLSSAGPDGIYNTIDDIGVEIPFISRDCKR